MPSGRLSAALEVLAVAARLGLTSFGGPVAHLGYFRNEYVVRQRWLDEPTYADVVALCQFLPGPASSQVGIAVGILRAGMPGGLAAWLGFTLPSALALVLFALFIRGADLSGAGWLLGLKIAAVAVVAQAVWGMARALCPDRERASIAIAAALVVTAWPGAWGQVAVIALAGVIGLGLLPAATDDSATRVRVPIGRPLAAAALTLFFALLLVLPILRYTTGAHALAVFDSFYRAGALVFGGGHVVLPLLQAEVVPPGWVTSEEFLAGYGAAQAVPGPLFTLSAYLGAVMRGRPSGWLGAGLALVAIFLPAFLLVVGALPFWDALRGRPQRGGRWPSARRALPPGVDERDPRARRLRFGPRRLRAAGLVEPAALGGGGLRGGGRPGDHAAPLSARRAAAARPAPGVSPPASPRGRARPGPRPRPGGGS
jgi:chromate transporter